MSIDRGTSPSPGFFKIKSKLEKNNKYISNVKKVKKKR
jgi:hypothetical protein